MKRYFLYSLILAVVITSCSDRVKSPELIGSLPKIYPDYTGVTIPVSIAPLNFDFVGGQCDRIDVTITGSRKGILHINASKVLLPEEEWSRLLTENKDGNLTFVVCVKQQGKWKKYRPFPVYVNSYPIDRYLVYRKIAPGYEVYSKMGIYQRDLHSFKEKALLENTLVPGMCVNCHSFNKTNPDYLSLHIRGSHGATLMKTDKHMEFLNTKTDSTLSACVYPYWHPTGKYIAYSVNNTRQAFHVVRNERIEVLDLASDVIVYHPQTHEILRSPLLQRKDAYETFPVFSSDGRKLYFCSSPAKDLPHDYKQVKYSLCSIDFDPVNGTFGERVDTIVNAMKTGKSISFPRPSYDGRYIMFTLSDYGNFSIWHKEADLWLLDLKNGNVIRSLSEVNSDNTESFHNWSSESHWFVFSSRRDDGLYTRLYLACIDNKGKISKPFMLPQETPEEYYTNSVYSYNTPDFASKPVIMDISKVREGIISDKRQLVRIRK